MGQIETMMQLGIDVLNAHHDLPRPQMINMQAFTNPSMQFTFAGSDALLNVARWGERLNEPVVLREWSSLMPRVSAVVESDGFDVTAGGLLREDIDALNWSDDVCEVFSRGFTVLPGLAGNPVIPARMLLDAYGAAAVA